MEEVASERDRLRDLRETVERLRNENSRLRERADQSRHVLDSTPVATLIKDRDGRILYVNAAGASGYGLSPESLLGRLEREVMPPGNPDTDEYLRHDREVIDSGKPALLTEFPFRAFDGSLLHLYISKFPMRYEARDAVLVVVYDLTELRKAVAERTRLERKVLDTQRLESLGVMAGGIAHDFNNLLVGVLSNAELALADVGASSSAARYLQRLRGAAEQLASLCRRMLAYTGHGGAASERLDLGETVRDLLELLEASLPKNTRLELEVGAPLPAIVADPAQIRQVAMNLITNASEAMSPNGGVVHVSVRGERFDPARHADLVVGTGSPPRDSVCLAVRDVGVGMDAATLRQLFDPFFTTKTTGRGLGLSAVLGIVRSHAGALHVQSGAGSGTTFRVWLPAAQPIAAPAPAPPVEGEEVKGAGRLVLVIDDERLVRQAARAMLRSRGFAVEMAEESDSALAALQRLGRPDAVLLDMSMPGRPVGETFDAIRAICPGLPIVLTSGFVESDVIRGLLRRERTAFVPKPFSVKALVTAVSSAIGA